MKNKILFEDFVNLLKTIILEYTYPMKKDVKGYGKGDFQKAGQWGLSNNKIYDEEGKEVEDKKDGFVYRNIPGVKYPFETKENSTQFGEFDKDDAIANEIINRLMFGGEKKKPLYLFFNGVVRMIHEGLAGEKNYKMLSDICIYLSENPTLLLKDKNLDPFKDKNWEGGFSDFYGKSFKELVKEFGSAAKQYCKEKKTKVIESDLITSNGYYVYPCYDFATANYVGTFMEQGMCYTGSDNFFHEHMGDSGVLFLFIKKDKPQAYDKNNRVYMGSGNLSLREFGIAVGVNEDKEPYIESITDGTNMSLYNSNYKESKTSKYFNKSDISKLSRIIGTLNGKDIFEYCIKATKERQNSKYNSIFNNGIYNRYDNLYKSKHTDDTTTTEIENLIVFYDNGKFICLDTVQKIVIIITTRGFITINGNEVINANEEPTLIKVSEFIGKFVTNWDGYKHNNRIKIKRTIEYHNVPTQEEPSQYRTALEESLKPKVRYNRNIKMKILNEENRVELIGTYKGHNITAMEDEFGMEYYCDDDFMNPFASIEDVKKMINMCDKQYSFVAEGCDRVFNDKGEKCFSTGKVWKGVEIAKNKKKVPKGFGGYPFIIYNGKMLGSKTPNAHDSFVRDEILSKRKFKNKEEYNKEEKLINNRNSSICGRLFPDVNSDGSSILAIWAPDVHDLFAVNKNDEIVILNAKRLSALIKLVGDFFNIEPSMIVVQFKERKQFQPTYKATDEDVTELLEYTHKLYLNNNNEDCVNDANLYTGYATKPYSGITQREREMFKQLRQKGIRGNEELSNHLMKHNPNFTQAQWNAMSTIGDSKISKKPLINEDKLRKIIRNTINEYFGFSKK